MTIRKWQPVAVLSALFLSLVVAPQAARADELKRRGMVGVQLGPVNDEAKQRLNLPSTKGVLFFGIVPDSAAQQAGLQADDVAIKIGTDEIDGLQTFTRTLRKYGAGDSLKFTVIRAGQEVTADVVLRPRPKETATDYELIYDSAGSPGQRVRTILTKPKDGGKFPAVLFVQGLAPNTVEFNFPQHPYKSVIAELTKAGFVTMRVERPGAGDSEGADVQDTTIEQDIAAFRSALTKLPSYEFVDPARVFVFSHSSGGAIVPMIAQGMPVKGVATFATFARPWNEHSLESSRRVWKLEMLKDDEIAAKADQEKLFNEELYGKKKAPKDILTDHPELKEYTSSFLQNDTLIHGVHYKYMQQLAALDIAAAWAKVNAAVLALWGESDFIAGKADSEQVASIVNKAHPGKAKFVVVPKVDHGYNEAEDQEESFLSQGGGKFNPVITETLIKWMKEQAGTQSS